MTGRRLTIGPKQIDHAGQGEDRPHHSLREGGNLQENCGDDNEKKSEKRAVENDEKLLPKGKLLPIDDKSVRRVRRVRCEDFAQTVSAVNAWPNSWNRTETKMIPTQIRVPIKLMLLR